MSDPWAALGFEEYVPPGAAGADPADNPPHPDAPAQQPADPPWYQILADKLHVGDFKRGGESLYDFGAGTAQGLSFNGADELMGMLPGTSVSEQQQLVRQAQERSPTAFGFGHAVGSAPWALATSGGSALEQAVMAALAGGADGFLGADGTPEQRTAAGTKGAIAGAAFAGAGAGSSAAGELAGDTADAARMRAWSTPGQFKVLARKEGLDYSEHDLVRAGEGLGLTNKVIPQSSRALADRAAAVVSSTGQGYGDAIDAAGAAGAQGNSQPVVDGLQNILADAQANPSSLGGVREGVASDLLTRLGPSRPMDPRELWALKKRYESAGGYVSDAVKKLPEGQAPLINRDASNFARGELNNAMATASPQIQDAYNTNRIDHSYAATIKALADEKAVDDAAGMGAWRAGGWIGAGGALGYPFGHGAEGALAGYATGQASRLYGPDLVANVGRGAEGALGALGDGMQSVAPAVGIGAGEAAASFERVRDQSKGHELEQVAIRAVNQDPQSLGPWGPKLQQAQQTGDPMAVSALLHEMNDDPQARQILYRLQAATNPQGGY